MSSQVMPGWNNLRVSAMVMDWRTETFASVIAGLRIIRSQ